MKRSRLESPGLYSSWAWREVYLEYLELRYLARSMLFVKRPVWFYPLSHNHGSGKLPYCRDPCCTSMIMGGRVVPYCDEISQVSCETWRKLRLSLQLFGCRGGQRIASRQGEVIFCVEPRATRVGWMDVMIYVGFFQGLKIPVSKSQMRKMHVMLYIYIYLDLAIFYGQMWVNIPDIEHFSINIYIYNIHFPKKIITTECSALRPLETWFLKVILYFH